MTAYHDIGAAVGPLRHIFIGADGSFQVAHGSNPDSYQVSPATSALGDGGTFLGYGYLYSPDFHDHDSTSVPELYAQAWDEHSQSAVATVDGVSRVITQLQTMGDDITLTRIDTYVHGQDCWRTDMILQNDYNTALTVRLYRSLNPLLYGDVSGYGVMRAGGVVGVAKTAGNIPAGAVLWLIPLVAAEYFEGDVNDLWDLLAGPSALPDTIVNGYRIDVGMGVAWELTIPPRSVVVRSCLTQVVIPQPVVPPTVDAWHFRGFCYRGESGDTGTPLSGVTLKLYGNNSNPPTVLRRQTISDAGGFWNFYEDQDYTNYLVEAIDPDGMTATGSATGDGTIVNNTKTKWLAPSRGVHDGNLFFKE